ncbi:helix-turn-helix domain-containing protein [Lentzea nigeriaca]|uniref:helix-turn-helix domain-containing protein n=1 Tax=Lentzea nigeriaca TaxID=1128665 RepID=UPI001EF8B708|nr:helix-turn-helix domain-containing protein [Lentzea nigeriaca]MBM7856378.1 DNA-binding response OmpR family regulator [Lentzea nigeriaca]
MSGAEVKLVRWPAEAASLARYRQMNVLRLLVVEGKAEPPITADVKEDWVRPPVSRADLMARIAALRARSDVYAVPHVDPAGLLRYGSRSVTVSTIGAALLARLADDFSDLVEREELLDLLPGNDGDRNALDLQIMRLRRRIGPLGLGIQTVRGRGYVLVPLEGAA